jgi:hypothetical protein
VRAGSTVVMIAADLLIIAKCISITNDMACVQAMYEIQTSHVRNMYAQVVEWKGACEYMKASKSRVFLLKHTPEARFECTADSLVEVSSIRLPTARPRRKRASPPNRNRGYNTVSNCQ